jgi:uncharacterized protein (TIGR04255 family)
MNEFKIQTSEEFEHLSHAPIIEAVIDIRAKASEAWELPQIAHSLKERLPDYPNMTERVQTEVKIKAGPPTQTEQHELQRGLRFKSDEGHRMATFSPDGFTFSVLAPYQNWERLRDEALRLWTIHAEFAKPAEVSRIGLRYINRIDLPASPEEVHLADYLVCCPSPPQDLMLPFAGFLHVDTLTTQPYNYPYMMNVVRTLQPAQPPLTGAGAIIIDIDVFVLQNVPLPDDGWIDKSLAEMRWLKNKAFFGSITAKAKELFK